MFARFVLVIALLCFVGCAVSDCVMNTTLPYRLPQTMRPQHYNIAIQLNEVVMPYSISGSSQIRISVELPTSCIVLHSANGNISNVSFVTNDSSTIQPTSISSVPEKQWFVISFSNNLPIGVGTLSLQFNGWLNTNNATGFFVSPLEVLPPTTQERPDDIESFLIETLGENWQTDGPVMFATQFEGPYARMAFPCFDEPSFKATFQVSLSIPSDSGMIALSNTPLMQQTAKNSYSVYQFEATPVPISCYLIAFAIGDFDYISTESRGIEYRIYTAPGKSSYGEFALNITVELMNYWADLWDFNYPFPKLDQISVPRIVQDGMENIGLITYWPGFLFPVPSTTAHYQKNCMVISHELSHLWFGDTVTLPWWSETYNNEGFARYLQYTGCHAIFPEWNTWEDGSFNYFSFAYSIIKQDSLGTLRPEIVLPREVSGTVSSVSNAFAGPTYPKGASLNRMFNIYMGDSNWNGALGYHLHKYQFTNPTTGDLLDSFDEYTNHTMDYKSKFMPWLTLSGFPIVTLDFDATRETLYVSQYPCSRYLPPRGQEYKWFITLPLSINGTLDSFIYVDFYNYSTKLHLPSLYPEFVQGNANHTSYFVVNYATLDQWYPVLQSMANLEYDEVLRNLLIQDVFILTQMSHQTIDLPLNLTSTWEKVNVNSLWSTLLPLWFEITVALDEQEYYPSLTEMLVTMLSSTVQNLPASGEPSYSSTVLFYDTFYGDSTMISNLLAKFRAGTPFTFAEQKAGYWAVGRYGTSAEFNQLLSMHSTASNSIQAQDILLGVTGPQNLQLCNTALVYFDDNLAIEDRLPAARNMLAYNSYCRSLAWDYIRVTGYQLFEAVGTSGASTFLNSFSGLLSTPEYLREATVYLEEMVSMGYLTEEQAQNAAVTIAINVDIVKTNTNWSSA